MKKLFFTVCMALAIVTSGVAQRYINNRSDLETFRNDVNNGNTFSGQTVYLNADIDLGGASWTPIANTYNKDGNGFQGTFDGQGHTINNFNCTIKRGGTNKPAFAGLFGLNRGTIKNLQVIGATVHAEAEDRLNINQAVAGVITAMNKGVIVNCCVRNSKVTSYTNYWAASGSNSFSGGIAGTQYEASGISNCYVSGVTLDATGRSGTQFENLISNKWSAQTNGWDDSNPQSNCCTSTSTYSSSWRSRRVEAAIKYVNNFGATDEPYYWDANGITPNIYYAVGVDETFARTASTTTPAVSDTYTHNNGIVYKLYNPGSEITVTTYPLGLATDNADAGYKLANVNGDYVEDYGNSANGRYYRTQSAKVTLPSSYPTNATVLSMEHTGLYGVSLESPAENVSNTLLADFDKSKAQVFNGAYFYNAGTQIPVTVYPLGMKVNGEDDGFLLRNADALGAVRTDLTTVEGDRYVRKFVYNHTVTSGKNTILYDVISSGLYRLTLADHGVDPAVRYDAAILTAPTMVASPHGEEYPMYRGGQEVTLEFYLEGFSGNWSNAGYFVDELIINGIGENNVTASYVWDASNDEEGNPTYSFETDRFLRRMQYEITMPYQVTEVGYTTMTTLPTDVEEVVAATRIYGVNGAVVVEAEAAQQVVVADMSGRIVYNGVVSQGRNAIELAAGFYLVNGTKVAVR